ncbi:hypothetical protein PENTCL1PPCAC_3666, partial [Pristionchus entomophagus]
VAESDDEEKKEIDMKMSLNPVVPQIENLTLDEECRDYFPILALPKELKEHVFSFLSLQDRLKARVNKSLAEIEAHSKYHVDVLCIGEKCCVRSPFCFSREGYPSAQFIALLESESYSTDFMRRIAHNASIGSLRIRLNGSSEFHREVFNLIKEIDIRYLGIYFANKDLGKEMMVEPFVLDLARFCTKMKSQIETVTAETIHEVYKIMIDGSTKLRYFVLLGSFDSEKCRKFFQFIGITYRDETLFSNRDVEVYETESSRYEEIWHIFDGHLEMNVSSCTFDDSYSGLYFSRFYLIRHDTQDSLEERKKGMERIEIDHE